VIFKKTQKLIVKFFEIKQNFQKKHFGFFEKKSDFFSQKVAMFRTHVSQMRIDPVGEGPLLDAFLLI
jgi:hypothetical protein